MEKTNFFPNQRKIRINRVKVERNSGLNYACIYKENMFEAMRNLKNSTFKVWLFLASNKDLYCLEYSPAYLSKVIKISIQTAKACFNELKDKGYIIQDDSNKNTYNFYEKPIEAETKRTILNPYTGEYMRLTYKETMNTFGYIEGIRLWG